mmetsp:Transcript_90920/g.266216  ORF Transcript_90920/g.266216 Transcript_90920/m.266216 type:complete len:108 (+) Transcript_90920:1305-1628(+)
MCSSSAMLMLLRLRPDISESMVFWRVAGEGDLGVAVSLSLGASELASSGDLDLDLDLLRIREIFCLILLGMAPHVIGQAVLGEQFRLSWRQPAPGRNQGLGGRGGCL